MPTSLLSFTRILLTGDDEIRQHLTAPLLVWEAPGGPPSEELLLRTKVVSVADAGEPVKPRHGEPLVFELKKASHKANAFMMGVTVGRTENNDLVLDDHSVSRFHAYFQQEAKTGKWKLVDAESKNGTWVAGKKLSPNQGEVLEDKQPIRFGDVELRFYLPEAFLEVLRTYAQH